MELKVWVEGIPRVVCGVTDTTSCQDVVVALAHAIGKTGRFTLVEKWRECERLVGPGENPMKILQKYGEYSNDVRFILRHSESRSARSSNRSDQTQGSGLQDFVPNFGSVDFRSSSSSAIKKSLTFSGPHAISASLPRPPKAKAPANASVAQDDGPSLQHHPQSSVDSSEDHSSVVSASSHSTVSPYGSLDHRRVGHGSPGRVSKQSSSPSNKRPEARGSPYAHHPAVNANQRNQRDHGGSKLERRPHVQRSSPLKSSTLPTTAPVTSVVPPVQEVHGQPRQIQPHQQQQQQPQQQQQQQQHQQQQQQQQQQQTSSSPSVRHAGKVPVPSIVTHQTHPPSVGPTSLNTTVATAKAQQQQQQQQQQSRPPPSSPIMHIDPPAPFDAKSINAQQNPTDVNSNETIKLNNTINSPDKQTSETNLIEDTAAQPPDNASKDASGKVKAQTSSEPQVSKDDLVQLVNLQIDKLQDQEMHFKSLEKEIFMWEDRDKEHEDKLGAVAMEMTHLEERDTEADSEIQDLEIVSWVDKLEMEQRKGQRLKAEVALIKRELIRCESELKTKQDQLNSLAVEVDAEKSSVSKDEEEKKRKELQMLQEISELQHEITEQLGQQREVAQSVDDLASEVAQLEASIAHKKVQIKDLEQELKETNMDIFSHSTTARCVRTSREGGKKVFDRLSPTRGGSARKMTHSPARLKEAVATAANPHGLWV